MIKWVIGIVVYLAIGILFGAVNFKITSDAIAAGKFIQKAPELPIEYVMFWVAMLIWPYEVTYVVYHIVKKSLGKKKD